MALLGSVVLTENWRRSDSCLSALYVESRKYKELLDAGILTKEEFAAKKHQLLGI